MERKRAGRIAVFAVAAVLAFPAGRVWGAEEWQSLDQPPFRFLYLEGNRSEALSLASRAPEILADLERDLGIHAPPAIAVRILPPRGEAAERRGSGDAPDWAVGYVPGSSDSVVLRGDLIRSYPFEDLLSLFGHELTHVLLDTLPVKEVAGLPRWFQEGVAVAESRRWSFRDVYTLGTTLWVGSPAPLSRITDSFPADEPSARAAYAESFSFIGFLEREHGPGAVRKIVAAMAEGETFDAAFNRVTGGTVAGVERAWRDRVTFAYRWVPALTSTSVLWIGITLLVLAGRLARRKRERAIQEAWEREGLG